jgi:hypothetical protein
MKLIRFGGSGSCAGTCFGWGGPVGWNNWRFDRDHREIRDHDDRFRDRDDRFRDRDHDRR